MLKLYSEKDVKRLVLRLKAEYEGVLQRHRASEEELKEQNRVLSSQVLALTEERANVSDAMISASKEGARIRIETAREVENERKELKLLAEKCRLFLDRLQKKYPDGEDVAEFAAFQQELSDRLGIDSEESGFDMDEVISPKEPLDLEKLCKNLGLMEDEA